MTRRGVAGLNRLVTRLRSTGAAVLVLGPIHDPRTTVPTCLSGHLDDALACSPPRPDAVNDAGIAAEERTAVVFSVWERSGRHSSRRQRGDGGARRAAGSSRRRSFRRSIRCRPSGLHRLLPGRHRHSSFSSRAALRRSQASRTSGLLAAYAFRSIAANRAVHQERACAEDDLVGDRRLPEPHLDPS
jgi:hypothetical protein